MIAHRFPETLLAELPGNGPWHIEPVGEQLANRTWLVRSAEYQFFAKQFRYEEVFARDLQQVLALEYYVAEQHLGPEIIYVDTQHKIVVYEHLPNSIHELVTEHETKLRILARAVAGIHRLAPRVSQWSLRDRLYTYCDSLTETHPVIASNLRRDLKDYSHLLSHWEAGPQVFCHLDLSMDHLFLNPHLRIIDWEYAGYSHPAFDVAMTVVMNDLFEDEIEVFLEEFNNHAPFQVTRDELPDWIRLVALVNRIWF